MKPTDRLNVKVHGLLEECGQIGEHEEEGPVVGELGHGYGPETGGRQYAPPRNL